jgi:hypothetical protein
LVGKPLGLEDTGAKERIVKKVGRWEITTEDVDLLSLVQNRA